MSTIIFVCSGNTCRSPMAAALAGRRLALGASHLTVASGGVDAGAGQAVSPQAAAVMEEMGLSLAGHRSRRVTRQDLRRAGLVLAMEGWQVDRLVELDPLSAARIFSLASFAGEAKDVSDPYGGDLVTYRRCALELDRLVDKALARYLAGPDFSSPGRE